MKPIAEKYLHSQVGKLTEEIKKAYLSKVPILFVVTKELHVIKSFATGNQLIKVTWKPKDGVTQICPGGTTTKEQETDDVNGFYRLNISDKNGAALISMNSPTLYVTFLEDQVENSHGAMQAYMQMKALMSLVKAHCEIVTPGTTDQSQRNVKASLAVVVCATLPNIPPQLQAYSKVIRVEPTEEWELREAISGMLCDLDGQTPKDEEYMRLLMLNMRGLGLVKVRQILRRIHAEFGKAYIGCGQEEERRELLSLIKKEKEEIIANSSILKLQHGVPKDISGMDAIMSWLRKIAPIMANTEEAKRKAYIRAPKGVLISGIPGAGKSLMAKITADILGKLPLIRMDMGSIMDKFVGQSEHRMDDALMLVEAMSPCVLWIDEIEKSMAGSHSNSGSDVMQRLCGKLLTWMQEKDEHGVCCFVFATANDISNLPPELFRSGRFDKKYYTFMPSAEECSNIFRGMVAKQNDNFLKLHADEPEEERQELFAPSIYADNLFFLNILNDQQHVLRQTLQADNEMLSRKNKFMTGADIEGLIEQAKLTIFTNHSGSFNGKYVCGEKEFKEALWEALGNSRTYGETDMENIAKCFLALEEKNFEPVSGQEIVPFDCFDPTRQATAVNEAKPPFDIRYKKETDSDLFFYQSLKHNYDQQLFLAVGHALNLYIRNKK